MAQRQHFAAGDADLGGAEERNVGRLALDHRLEDGLGIRPVHAETEVGAAGGVLRSLVVALYGYVVAAGHGVEVHPILQMHAADEFEPVLRQILQHRLADDRALVVAGYELFGTPGAEVGEAVDADVAEQLERVGPLQEQLWHVVRLVEQHGGLAPGVLFVAPVGELRRHRARAGPVAVVWGRGVVAEVVDQVRGCVDQVLQ